MDRADCELCLKEYLSQRNSTMEFLTFLFIYKTVNERLLLYLTVLHFCVISKYLRKNAASSCFFVVSKVHLKLLYSTEWFLWMVTLFTSLEHTNWLAFIQIIHINVCWLYELWILNGVDELRSWSIDLKTKENELEKKNPLNCWELIYGNEHLNKDINLIDLKGIFMNIIWSKLTFNNSVR